jgi:hypothetical protein
LKNMAILIRKITSIKQKPGQSTRVSQSKQS